jgi:hypothetical protein
VITTFVILNSIGRGLLPKGAAFRIKKQAIVPKAGLEIKFGKLRILTKEELLAGDGSKKIVYWHLCKFLISFPSSLFSLSYVILKNLNFHPSPQKQAMSLYKYIISNILSQ